MAPNQELQVQEKRQVDKRQESTTPVRSFLPVTDIFETDQNLTLVIEMPGVAKDDVSVNVENDVLEIDGRVDFSKYESLQPIYTEYNVGHYKRSFSLSDKIDQGAINAGMEDGVLTLVLPKAEQAKPRKIRIG